MISSGNEGKQLCIQTYFGGTAIASKAQSVDGGGEDDAAADVKLGRVFDSQNRGFL